MVASDHRLGLPRDWRWSAVTFAAPALLSGLIVIPLAMLAYGALQGRRRREAAAWANPALVPGLVTGRPGWRRHLPALLLALALTGLVIALARPQRTVAAPQRAATVVMVTDLSGSMNATDVQPTRLEAAVNAAKTLASKLPPAFRLGLVTFSDFAELRAAPTTDRSQVDFALDQLVADGATAMGDGLARALQAATTPAPGPDGNGVRRLPAAIVLLSDGANNAGSEQPLDVARQARQAHVPIYTVALGTPEGEIPQRGRFGFVQLQPVPPDPEALGQIARISGGRAFTAQDADKLQSIYAKLGTGLSSKPVKQEVTAAFVGGALAFLVAGGALSLRWFGRLL
jgi:Ca-activated chloride channel homolog